jgi:hypothetical protein
VPTIAVGFTGSVNAGVVVLCEVLSQATISMVTLDIPAGMSYQNSYCPELLKFDVSSSTPLIRSSTCTMPRSSLAVDLTISSARSYSTVVTVGCSRFTVGGRS